MSDYEFTSVPDPIADVGNLAEVTRALKRTMEVLVEKANVWDEKILALQNATGQAPTGSGTGTGQVFGTAAASDTKSKYNFDNPSYDAVFDAATKAASHEVTSLRSDVINTRAQLQAGVDELFTQATNAQTQTVADLNALSGSLTSAVNDFNGQIRYLHTASKALGGSMNMLSVQIGQNKAAITTEQAVRANEDEALAGQITTISSSVSANTAAISAEATTRANADSAISATVTSLTSTVNSNTAAISSEATARANADTAISATVSSLTSTVNSNTAAISSEASARATADGALSSRIDTVQTNTDYGSAGGYYRITAVSSPADGAASEFAVQVKASSGASFSNAGMRIQAFSNGTSRIKMMADQFLLQSSSGNYTPFAVVSGQLISNAITSAGNVSGLGALATQNSVSASNVSGLGSMAMINKISALNIATYMDNAVISNAFIGNAEVSTLKIAGNAITQAASVYSGSQQDITASGYWQSLLSLSIYISGTQPLLVWASLGVPAAHVALSGENQDVYFEGNWYKINQYMTDLYFQFSLSGASSASSGIVGHYNTGFTNGGGGASCVSLQYTFSPPPAGWYTLTLQAQKAAGWASESCGARTISMSALETKR